jgi:hypothetical protein
MATPTWLFSLASASGVRSSFYGQESCFCSNTKSLVLLIMRSRTFLLILLIGCTILATAIGPASAMLFAPAQFWIKVTGTRFYIGGAEDILWPAVLTRNHTGSSNCLQSPLRMDFNSCLYGSWRVLLGSVTTLRPVRPALAFYIPGGGAYEFPPAALIHGNIPTPESNFTRGDPGIWAVAPGVGVASHMDYLNQQTVQAFGHAQEWRRRLLDVGENRVVLTTGERFTVVRTVCTDRTIVSAPLTKLELPLLEEDEF